MYEKTFKSEYFLIKFVFLVKNLQQIDFTIPASFIFLFQRQVPFLSPIFLLSFFFVVHVHLSGNGDLYCMHI